MAAPEGVATGRTSPLLIREYGAAREFERHAAALAAEGWRPLSVRTRRRSPTWDLLTLGLAPLLGLGEPALLVTYTAQTTHPAG